jgi:hypothetical protein
MSGANFSLPVYRQQIGLFFFGNDFFIKDSSGKKCRECLLRKPVEKWGHIPFSEGHGVPEAKNEMSKMPDRKSRDKEVL